MCERHLQLVGVYEYFWRTLRHSTFIENYFPIDDDHFFRFLQDREVYVFEFVQAITLKHNKSAPTLAALEQLNILENSLGLLKKVHRGHLIHSVNVLLLGLCLFEEHPKLKRALLRNPGDRINPRRPKPYGDENDFFFRWIFAALFHDIGYGFQLLAEGTNPDILGVNWDGSEAIQEGLRRLQANVQKGLRAYMRDLRRLPAIAYNERHDRPDEVYTEFHGLNRGGTPTNTDIVRHFADLIDEAGERTPTKDGKVIRWLRKIFDEAFVTGRDITFDHGKISSFLLLHEVQNSYVNGRVNHAGGNLSWDRANVYYDLMDSALAIFLHNTIRFQPLVPGKKYRIGQIPALTYLLAICDLIVEWERPSQGRSDKRGVEPRRVTISSDPDRQTAVRYEDFTDIADDVRRKIIDTFDQSFLAFRIEA